MLFNVSCSKNDDNSDDNSTDNSPAGEAVFQATIDGDTYSNYDFTIGVYEVVKGTTGNTLSINTGDINGEMVSLFLNGTDGFSSGTVKEMGDVDADSFTTFATVRQASPQITYFSNGGSVTITNNREHPSETGHRLLSGTFNITAATIDGINTLSLSGSFTELDFVD
ncbi:MAG: hypothetical protein Aureis2KO_00560 [Aureisphaera sp.]